MRSGRFARQAHPRCVRYSQARSRPSNCSAAGCRAAEKYARSRRALVDFSPGAHAELQVFSRRAVGPATFLRPAAELLINTHALDALWQIFRQARPRSFRYSQARSRPRNFSATGCRAVEKCTPATTSTARSVSFFGCVFAGMAYLPVAASPGPVFVGRGSAGNS